MNNPLKNHTPSTLSQLQNDFQAYLLDSSPNSIKSAAFIKLIINDKKVGVNTRLGIYYKAYRLRMIEALANTYPILKALLGDDLFEKTARSYIENYPSTVRNMRCVGDQMSAHINKTLPQYPIAVEIAAFEWGLSLAFDAKDAPILTLQDLVNIPPENWADLRFQFHPSMQLFTFKLNVLRLWQALNNNEAIPKIIQINEDCIVWRKDLNSHYRSLESAEHAAIQYVTAGASFGELCEFLQENADSEDATMKAAQCLSVWLNEGLISTM